MHRQLRSDETSSDVLFKIRDHGLCPSIPTNPTSVVKQKAANGPNYGDPCPSSEFESGHPLQTRVSMWCKLRRQHASTSSNHVVDQARRSCPRPGEAQDPAGAGLFAADHQTLRQLQHAARGALGAGGAVVSGASASSSQGASDHWLSGLALRGGGRAASSRSLPPRCAGRRQSVEAGDGEVRGSVNASPKVSTTRHGPHARVSPRGIGNSRRARRRRWGTGHARAGDDEPGPFPTG